MINMYTASHRLDDQRLGLVNLGTNRGGFRAKIHSIRLAPARGEIICPLTIYTSAFYDIGGKASRGLLFGGRTPPEAWLVGR